MKIIHTDDFSRALNNLPKEIRRFCACQEKIFRENWRDPRLHIKKVKFLPSAFSFRVTRRYRAFFYFQDIVTAIFFDIDHRKDAYRNY